MKEPELAGAAEAAKLLGINKQNFCTRISKRFDFPKPVAKLKMGPIWLRDDIMRWKEKHK